MPIRAYKHVAADFADAFQSGRAIRIATHDSFAAIENGRADILDGAAALTIDNLRSGSMSAAQTERLAPFMVLPDSVEISGVTLIQQESDQYVFCASTAPDYSRLHLGERIFEIGDLERFATLIREATKRYLGRPKVRAVTYAARVSSTDDEVIARADPFIKAPHFAGEHEVRIVWPVNELRGESLIIEAPVLRRLIRPHLDTPQNDVESRAREAANQQLEP